MQLFREVLFAVVNEHRLPLDKHDGEIIGHSIEEATCEAIISYSATRKQVSESFIAALSHDLRNPLNVASASAQLIERKSHEPGVVDLAKRIGRKIAEADGMIQTLLDAAMLTRRMKLKLKLTCFPILELVEEVCADVPLTGTRVEVNGEPVEGWWCRATLKRVLENLIDNAQKYGDASQPIMLRVARVDHRVHLSVHNEGEPIPEPELKRLFDPFERLEDVKVKGWGLGLPFVQNAVESHGGDVVVDSARERGTTFTLSMPVDARPYVEG
jgi:signal transduction histidine kinase